MAEEAGIAARVRYEATPTGKIEKAKAAADTAYAEYWEDQMKQIARNAELASLGRQWDDSPAGRAEKRRMAAFRGAERLIEKEND